MASSGRLVACKLNRSKKRIITGVSVPAVVCVDCDNNAVWLDKSKTRLSTRTVEGDGFFWFASFACLGAQSDRSMHSIASLVFYGGLWSPGSIIVVWLLLAAFVAEFNLYP